MIPRATKAMTAVRADGSEATKAATKAATDGVTRRTRREETNREIKTRAIEIPDGPGEDENGSRNKGTGLFRSPCRFIGAWFYLSFAFHTFIL